MTNEELSKLVHYSHQLSTFALNMQNEALTMSQLKWQKYALKVLAITLEIDEDIREEKANKINVVL